ncbi:MAG: 4'-phosphopantetheinyl transferase superfamily protein [Caldilineaceae bacterium]|nr:4'-phosphopantetheinyl transferase superfamily protein [Caldilineaceae bacterium]
MSRLSESAQQIAMVDGVSIWLCSLERLAAQADAYAPFLNTEERRRADRFHCARDRHRFVIGRAVLRLILGEVVGELPTQIMLGYGAYGKPYLLNQPASEDLRFNLAHAAGVAIYAVARGREVGIDLEDVRPLSDAAAIAERFFAPVEVAAFRTVLGTADEALAFFNAWTRKEAFLKALGDGLARPLDSFAVSLLPGDEPRFLWIDGDRVACWHLHAWQPCPGYVAALVMPTRPAATAAEDPPAAPGPPPPYPRL